MCGIFGFAGKLGNHEFNILKFSTLGAMNDARGGDSAGAFIDKKFAHAVGDQKLFLNFTIKNNFLNEFQGVPVQYALGHCRKASVGKKTILEAQPVVIPGEEDIPEFAMIHNGTLLNHEELRDKYLSKTPDHFTDSQIFAYIVYYYGFKVLTEYYGAGAFAFLDYRTKTPTMYLFRGESPLYKTSPNTSSERPLFWLKKPDGIWFSSIKESLEFIDLGENSVEEVPANTLFIIKDGKVVSSKTYNRSAMYQCNNTTGTLYGYSGYNEYDYDDYYSRSYQNSRSSYQSPYSSSVERTYSATTFVLSEREEEYDKPASNKIIFKGGLYYKGQQLLHGCHKISEYGFENTYSDSGYSSVILPKPFYFFHGYLMKDGLNYEIAVELEKQLGENFKLEYIRKLVMTAYYDLKTKKFYTRKGKSYTGSYPIYFSLTNTKYSISGGFIYQYTEKYDPKSCTVWRLYSPQYSGTDIKEKYQALIQKSVKKIISKI